MINKLKFNVMIGVLVVFLAGMIFGGLLTTGFMFKKMRQFTEGSGTFQHRWMLRRLSRALDLTAEQKPQVEQVLAQSNQETAQLLRRALTEFAAIMARQHTELKTVLTPEQQIQLDRHFGRLRSPWMPTAPPDE